MPNQERIEQLEAFKIKERFMLEHWEDREMESSSEQVIEQMRTEVLRFTDFLIYQISAKSPNIQQLVQDYFMEWDNENFSQDETEFIVEVEYEAMRIAGIKIDDLLI